MTRPTQTERVLREIAAERTHQWGQEDHPSFVPPFGDSLPTDHVAMLITADDFSEAFGECDSLVDLRAGFVQAAATFVAWIESLDRDHAPREELELNANELLVGDLFEYVGSFAQYKVESTPEYVHAPGRVRVVFQHSRNGAMIGTGIRLAPDRSVVVWREVAGK